MHMHQPIGTIYDEKIENTFQSQDLEQSKTTKKVHLSHIKRQYILRRSQKQNLDQFPVQRETITRYYQYCSICLNFNPMYLPLGFISLRKEEPLPELFPQTPVPSYSRPRSTQVADKIVSPSCFRSSLPPCPLSWCPLCHSFSPPVYVETCNVSRPSVYSLLDNVYDVIYTCLMSYPGITFVVT